jgi:hypothetical protein
MKLGVRIDRNSSSASDGEESLGEVRSGALLKAASLIPAPGLECDPEPAESNE